MFTQEVATETVLAIQFLLTQQWWDSIHKVLKLSSFFKKRNNMSLMAHYNEKKQAQK